LRERSPLADAGREARRSVSFSADLSAERLGLVPARRVLAGCCSVEAVLWATRRTVVVGRFEAVPVWVALDRVDFDRPLVDPTVPARAVFARAAFDRCVLDRAMTGSVPGGFAPPDAVGADTAGADLAALAREVLVAPPPVVLERAALDPAGVGTATLGLAGLGAEVGGSGRGGVAAMKAGCGTATGSAGSAVVGRGWAGLTACPASRPVFVSGSAADTAASAGGDSGPCWAAAAAGAAAAGARSATASAAA